MRRRSSVWLVAVAQALTPPTGLRKLTRSVAAPDLLDHNDAVTFLQETGVPTFAADEDWLELDDAAPSRVVKPVDGAAAIFSALCEQPNLASFLVVRDQGLLTQCQHRPVVCTQHSMPL